MGDLYLLTFVYFNVYFTSFIRVQIMPVIPIKTLNRAKLLFEEYKDFLIILLTPRFKGWQCTYYITKMLNPARLPKHSGI